ncbi:MAG: acetolactate synthase large subunit, partial [Pseudomonadales bacterium]|nr:acetolactate synthase large subunit [Pseudomonadales bacterium]
TPADACWGPASVTDIALPELKPPMIADDTIRRIGERLDAQSMILLNGDGLTPAGLVAAGRVASVIGCKVAVTTFPARIDNGAGQPSFMRLPYFPEHILATLKDTSLLVLAGAEAPVSFFAYPDTPGYLVPETCDLERLAGCEEDVVDALERLADHVNAPMDGYAVNDDSLPDMPTGDLSAAAAGAIIARLLPEGAIICGDSGGGGAAFVPTRNSAPHTWLNLTGGSIGQGGPVSIGASVACPDRRVLALLGDGASMYTNQAFWTQAREGLNVTTVIYNNRRYGILETEYLRLGVNEIGERAASLFDLGQPHIDFVGLAGSMGVPGTVAKTAEDFQQAMALSFSQPGPFVIEARV